jgi:hypothetical protein
MRESEKNICKDLGCPGICCTNVRGNNAVREDWFRLAFPDAVNVGTVDNLVECEQVHKEGVFYVSYSGWVHVVINGRCPNQKENGDCNVHQEPFYPNMCKNFAPEAVS